MHWEAQRCTTDATSNDDASGLALATNVRDRNRNPLAGTRCLRTGQTVNFDELWAVTVAGEEDGRERSSSPSLHSGGIYLERNGRLIRPTFVTMIAPILALQFICISDDVESADRRVICLPLTDARGYNTKQNDI